MKKVFLGISILLSSLSLLGSKANAENVYIPDKQLRENIEWYIQSPIQNSLPTAMDMLKLKNEENDEMGFGVIRSIEGLQYATNVERISISSMENILDMRPISELKNLKSYYTYSSLHDDLTITNDISPFSKLANLERLDLGYANVYDLTPLENLSKLSYFNSHSVPIDFQKAYVSKELQTFIIESPVKYSSQFTNITIAGTIYGKDNGKDKSTSFQCELSNNAIIIKDLPSWTETIDLEMTGESETFDWSKGFHSFMQLTIPIEWY